MKLLKTLLVFVVFLCVSVILCSDAQSATRIAVESVSFFDDENPVNYTSQREVQEFQKLCEKYKKLLIAELSKAGFDAVEITDKEFIAEIYAEAQNYSSNTGKKKSNEYKPTYNRGMTATADYDVEKVMKNQDARSMKMAKERNCRYLVDGSIQFYSDAAVAILSVFDTENPHQTLQERAFAGEARGSIQKVSFEDRKTNEDRKTKNRSKTSSSSKSKKSQKGKSSVNDSVREQIVSRAFSKAIANFQDSQTGDVAKIVKIAGNDIFINKGSKSKVEVGDAYVVRTEAYDGMADIFGADTNSSKTVNIAIIQIKDVQEDSSIAEVMPDGGNVNAVQLDDTLGFSSVRDAKNYLSQILEGKIAPFPTKHPGVKKAEVKSAESTSTVATNKASNFKDEKTASSASQLPALPPGVMRIGIVNFDSKADGVSSEEASSLTDLLSRMLSNSDKIAVLERDSLESIAREQKLNAAGIIDPATAAQLGKLASCQYILLGSVTGRRESDTISGQYIRPTERADYLRYYKAGMSNAATGVLIGLQVISMIAEASNAQKENIVTETHEVITNVDVRLVDVSTSQIMMAFTEQGSAAQSDVVTQDGNGEIKGVDVNYGSLENRALASTAANISNKIRELLADEKLQISSVNGDEIIINRGASSGIQLEDLFCIYTDGQSGGDTEAIISVKDVQEAFSTAELAKSLSDSYAVVPGSKLESVLHSDFQKGIWHVKNQKRAQASEKEKQDISLEELANSFSRKKHFETSSTEAKKVIKSYGLPASKEMELVNAHKKASKANNNKKKYEAYRQLSEANNDDFLAAYYTGKYALEQSMYMEAREWASKALFVNPNYKPAKTLIERIDNGD